jgi:cyclic-di-AMP phosphodiesterase PgpH
MLRWLNILRRATPRRVRQRELAPGLTRFLEESRLIAGIIFVATVASIALISFVGVTTSNLPVLPNQAASVRIVASEPFSFVSVERTREKRAQLRDRVPPVFRLEFEPLLQFETHIQELLAQLQSHEAAAGGDGLTHELALAELVETFNAGGPYRAGVEDVRALLELGDAERRREVADYALAILGEIYAQGVHDTPALTAGTSPDLLTVYQLIGPDGSVSTKSVESLEEALTFLRINLATEKVARPTALALFRLFRNGVTPNLVYDQPATQARQDAALATLQPVTVQVQRGQTLIEPGTRVTPEQYEMLVAHRQHLLETGGIAAHEGLQLFGRTLFVLAMVMAGVLYIRLEDRETFTSNSRLGLLALVVVLNLTLVRTSYELGGLPFFVAHSGAAALLPYLAPTVLAPLIVAILIDAGSAVFMALLISIFTGVIYGNRLDLLVISFLAAMIAIFCAQGKRRRGAIVRATTLGGLSVAVFVLLIGFVDQLPVVTVLLQMAAGLVTGVLTGIVVVGLLPLLEGLFKRTTDITLLELTDFNHPLLRRLQMEAPGTYHHSLVVAQLAENAANAIGANALRARVCSLFHDIGKLAKPEYFTENQREGVNPHDASNPSLSALIIKSHVKEGVDLAYQHRLPRVVVNVIRQHHGTSLIRYFFHRAVTRERAATGTPVPFPPGGAKDPILPGLGPVPVSESTYRYDGPKPQFKESAIIFLADSCEAASRSLAKVSPQAIEDLVAGIVGNYVGDGQLDESPLTLAEIDKIKRSFVFSLLNMLHARVAYPGKESTPGTSTPPPA